MYRGYYTQKFIMALLPSHLKDDAITQNWETCSSTVGAKVFNDMEFKKTIYKNKTKIRKIKAEINVVVSLLKMLQECRKK